MNFYHFRKQLHESSSVVISEDGGLPRSDVFSKRLRYKKRLVEQIDLSEAKAAIEGNVSLIKTIPQKMFPRIERMVLRVFQGLSDRDGLIRWLQKAGGVTEARARLIADDQIAKASEAFLRLKWKKQGVQYVKWVHGSPAEPREYHQTAWDGRSGANGRPNGLHGFVFPIDHPPVIDKRTGERGYPAQLVGCTCHLEPVRKSGRTE